MTSRYILILSCADRPGIVHAVTGVLVGHRANILASQQFGDPDSGLFFMRVEFEMPDPAEPRSLDDDLGQLATTFDMTWALHSAQAKTGVVILVSKLGHCLNDLLFRSRSGQLPVEIVAVVSNHPDLEALVGSYDLPYHYAPITAATRPDAERQLRQVITEHQAELARYMQILGEELCRDFAGRIINIHHSFLPSFRGARPYHQAHDRGVKLIGATAHYVTAELDEGPIIEQDVERVDHSLDPEQLAAVGHDIECQVLARAVRWHAEHRVLLNGGRTVVFR